MMMVYGFFVFTLKTAPYQQLRHNKQWRHVKNERINRSAKWQYIGAGDDQITLDGVLYPEITGGNLSLTALETIGYIGLPWPLISGVGKIYGMYVLESLQQTRAEFDRYGNPKKIEFTITLQRTNEDILEKLQSASLRDLFNNLMGGITSAFNSVSGAVSSIF